MAMKSLLRGLAGGVAALALVGPVLAQSPASEAAASAWYGLSLPQGLSDPFEPVVPFTGGSIGTTPPLKPFPASSPLSGARILADVKTIIDFSRASRASGDGMWGRISGRPGLMQTQEWVVREMKAAGIANAELQTFPLPQPQWMPTRWEVKVLADPAYGPGSRDIVLGSAFPQPLAASPPGGSLTAPLVFVGSGTELGLSNVDVRGKIAVIHVVPRPAILYSESVGSAQRAMDAGAVGVINVIESPGNLQFVDTRFGCRTGPCFSVGGDDGYFLLQAIGKAATGKAPPVRAKLAVESELPPGQVSANAVGVIKGKSEKVILTIAHADGYFDAAGDNADGLAMMIAQIRHFAAKRETPDHTLVFVSTAGHHGPGNGPRDFIKTNPTLTANTVLLINLEHISQVDLVTSPVAASRVGRFPVPLPSTTEMAKKAGVTNQSPFVVDLLKTGIRDYGLVANQIITSSAPGDAGAFVQLNIPAVGLIGSGVFYHSSGDTFANISQNGLERAAGFYADFLEKLDKASDDKFAAGPDAPPARDPSLMPERR